MSLVKKLKSNRGFTLVELMIVVVIIGILAALAIYGVRQYVTNAKSAEARLAVGRMAKDAVSAASGERMTGDLLAVGTVRGSTNNLCQSALQAVPQALQDEGQKYQPDPGVDWLTPVGTQFREQTGWTCLRFSIEDPIYFQYDYRAQQAGFPNNPYAVGDAFTASAQAFLGGNFKVFYMNGIVQSDQAGNPVLTLSPSIIEFDSTTAITNPEDFTGAGSLN